MYLLWIMRTRRWPSALCSVSCVSGLLSANIRIHKEGDHELGSHDAPDNGFAPDNGAIGEAGNQQGHEEGFADELDDAGDHGQDFFADALQGHFGLVQQTQYKVEGANDPQVAGGVPDNGGIDPYYTIPVKKVNAENMLDELASTVYTFYLSMGATWRYDEDFTKAVETYDVQPLPDNLKQQLQYMLDNIGGASLPEASVYVPLVWHMEAYAFELETMDEAYENACADLEKHMQYIMAGDSEMDFSFNGYTRSFLK